MLIEIAPPLIGQSFGLGPRDIAKLIISSRYEGQSLFPITDWPTHVYVARVLDDTIISSLSFVHNQVELIAWGSIFSSLDQANDFASSFSR